MDVVEVFKSLMADISRIFEKIAQKRDKRKTKVDSFYNKLIVN